MTDTRQPIFDLADMFDCDIPIGDRALPIHVKRMSRAELEAFDKRWKTLVVAPRGSAIPSAGATSTEKVDYMATEVARLKEWNESVEAERLKFYEDAIREYITVDAGLLRDRGKDVTDGAGLIGMFHSRPDVLSDLLAAIYIQNHLGGVIRKNSNSPRAIAPGSGPSTPAHGEDKSGSTAGRVAASDSAANSAATDESSAAAADGSAPCGETPKVH